MYSDFSTPRREACPATRLGVRCARRALPGAGGWVRGRADPLPPDRGSYPRYRYRWALRKIRLARRESDVCGPKYAAR